MTWRQVSPSPQSTNSSTVSLVIACMDMSGPSVAIAASSRSRWSLSPLEFCRTRLHGTPRACALPIGYLLAGRRISGSTVARTSRSVLPYGQVVANKRVLWLVRGCVLRGCLRAAGADRPCCPAGSGESMTHCSTRFGNGSIYLTLGDRSYPVAPDGRHTLALLSFIYQLFCGCSCRGSERHQFGVVGIEDLIGPVARPKRCPGGAVSAGSLIDREPGLFIHLVSTGERFLGCLSESACAGRESEQASDRELARSSKRVNIPG